jgi:hypothetical protein
MEREENEIKLFLSKFNAMLELLDDDRKNADEFARFLRLFLRVKPRTHSLPMMEVMTVLKYRKPYVFESIKARGKNESYFQFLTGITTDLRTAEKNLYEYHFGKTSPLKTV